MFNIDTQTLSKQTRREASKNKVSDNQTSTKHINKK